MLTERDWELEQKVDCNLCENSDMCDQVKYDCPRIDFKNEAIDGTEVSK